MKPGHFFAFSMVFLLLTSCTPEGAKPANASPTRRPATDEEFIQSFVAATRSGNPANVRDLVHPECLRQVDKGKEQFFADRLAREANLSIPANPKATITTIPADAPLPFEGPFVYPVRPTRTIQIDFEDPERGSKAVIRQVVMDDGGWWLVIPFPTDETLTQIQTRAQDEQSEQPSRTLARNVTEPLLGELRALLRSGRKIAAIERYREVSGEGLRVAKSVIFTKTIRTLRTNSTT